MPSTKNHYLTRAVVGVNRYVPGEYVCKCGIVYSTRALFYKHAAKMERHEKAQRMVESHV
jgi:hypothetical protein